MRGHSFVGDGDGDGDGDLPCGLRAVTAAQGGCSKSLGEEEAASQMLYNKPNFSTQNHQFPCS